MTEQRDDNAVIKGIIWVGIGDTVLILLAAFLIARGEGWANFGAFGLCAIASILTIHVILERAHVQRREIIEERRKLVREKAGLRMIEARTALTEAKTDVLSRPIPQDTRLIEAPPEMVSGPRIYQNGVLVSGHGQEQLEDIELDDPPDADPLDSRGRPIMVSESEADRAVRIRKLANDIYSLCRDCNPTQANIKARIAMTPGGLLRSNQDITDALDVLAGRGWVSAAQGQGIARLWLRDGVPVDYSARARVGARER